MANKPKDEQSAREAAYEKALYIASEGELSPDRAMAVAIGLGYAAALEHERGKWTDIHSEDYPTDMRTVWITFRSDFAKRSSVATAFYDNEQWFWTDVDEGGDAVPMPHAVLAWMPYVTPEPYVAPGENNEK